MIVVVEEHEVHLYSHKKYSWSEGFDPEQDEWLKLPIPNQFFTDIKKEICSIL